jgi:hypothetical protein
MRAEDLEAIKNTWPSWADRIKEDRIREGKDYHKIRIAIFDPTHRELEFVQYLFPFSDISIQFIEDWHLNNPCPHGNDAYDLVVASNVFFCSGDPELWFKNVMAATRYFWLQDAISGRRGHWGDYLGDDGDKMRFSMPHCKSDFPGAFDMSVLSSQIIFFEPFLLVDNNKHFLMYLESH